VRKRCLSLHTLRRLWGYFREYSKEGGGGGKSERKKVREGWSPPSDMTFLLICSSFFSFAPSRCSLLLIYHPLSPTTFSTHFHPPGCARYARACKTFPCFRYKNFFLAFAFVSKTPHKHTSNHLGHPISRVFQF